MPETAEIKIKLLKRMLTREKQVSEDFLNLDKTLSDNEFYIKAQLQTLEENMKAATSLDRQIITMCEEDDPVFINYTNDGIYENLRNLYCLQTMRFNESLKSISHSSDSFSLGGHSTQINANQSSILNLSQVKLPRITIDPFDGNYSKWADFKDIFESSINSNPSLCNSTKLQYLQTFLKGEALKVIKRGSERLKPENYNSIWAALTKRYEHRRSLANSYFQLLFNQKTIIKETSSDLKNLHDTTYDALSSLENLGLKTENWGDLLVFLVNSKLPLHTKELWEEKIGENDQLPEFDSFMKFIETRFRTLEGIESTKSQSQEVGARNFMHKKTTLHTESNVKKPNTEQTRNQKCKCCQKDSHYLFKCEKFKQLNTDAKVKVVKQNNHCYNCLGFHRVETCTSTSRCQKCNKKHHTMLHFETRVNVARNVGNVEAATNVPQSPPERGVPSTSDGRFSHQNTTMIAKTNSAVLFPTALINVINSNGYALRFRALVDACSDESYVTERVVRKLQLKTNSRLVETSGLGGVSTMSSESVTSLTIQSLVQPEFLMKLQAYVLPKISAIRPTSQLDKPIVPQDISLADPNFHLPTEVDMLLGGNVDALISMSGCLKYPDENLVLKQTRLGWIASGGKAQSQCFTISTRNQKQETRETLESLDKNMRRFWEIEEPSKKNLLTTEEKLAERIYEATTERRTDGKYVVSLPFKNETKTFSNMRKIAMSRYFQLENKLSRNDKLYTEYSDCLNDYISKNHMNEVNPEEFPNAYYIPHHCVFKESSTTTKLRVVFDASAKDSNMNSLNANLLNGPRLQDDLLDLLIRFRTYKFAFNADIQQMYRQIWINPNDRRFQLMLWKPTPGSSIKTYALNTVTFGTTSAPYLAVKTLYRLAKDERINFPLGSDCLENGFYVDDFIYGADTIEKALQIQKETKRILETAGFNLRKWSANDQRLLDGIPLEDRETKSLLSFGDIEQSVKTLGIHWSPLDDNFHFQINVNNLTEYTKRTMLSNIAKIFDPLGWLSPCTIIAKLMIQKLWIKQQEWDEPISEELRKEWSKLSETLPCLQEIKLPRWIGTLQTIKVELHGFSDASEKAYAAVIYVRSDDVINVLFAKTKVAPLKRVSLPRLELCAAHLLAKLMKQAKKILKLDNTTSYCWSDSTITLAWIKDSPHKRATYVANRVSEIQSLTSPTNWHHVKSQENPADLATRGISPSELNANVLWWQGPEFLKTFEHTAQDFEEFGNIQLPEEENKKEIRETVKQTMVLESFVSTRRMPMTETTSNIVLLQVGHSEILNKFSTLPKLVRVVAYCMRTLKRNRPKDIYISPTEYDNALLTILRMVQAESFPEEISLLEKKKPISRKSDILALSPMLSEKDNLLRINSRISNADHLSFDQKFPIILPRRHFVSQLITRHAHIATFHGTQQQTLLLINQRYHIIRGTTLVKNVIHNCIKCFRFKCGVQSQLMAPLPYSRTTPNIRPFQSCGVDLAGPFNIKKWKGRCNQFLKAYFAIFVCFSTKAVHIEVVVDLSSAEFIAAYRRFISRRGVPTDIHSDCGTNFVGAEGIITRKRSEYLEKWNSEMAKQMSEFHTTWHFNSPSAPHMGGLWEAGVKSTKHHLKRIIGNASLSYDEFETTLIQIEACLNSRPLTHINDSPDTLILTPAHFLVQGPLNALPERNLNTDKISCVDRWNYLQRLVQQFWKLWSQDYLNTLRERKKWRQSTKNVEINDVVLIKDSNVPPTVWPMGIVTEIHPGNDGLVRVVTVTSNNKSAQRPIVKLAPLPLSTSH